MVEPQPSKLAMPVRSRSPALVRPARGPPPAHTTGGWRPHRSATATLLSGRVAYRAATRLDRVDCALFPTALMAWTVKRYLPAEARFITNARAVAGWIPDPAVDGTVPAVFSRT